MATTAQRIKILDEEEEVDGQCSSRDAPPPRSSRKKKKMIGNTNQSTPAGLSRPFGNKHNSNSTSFRQSLRGKNKEEGGGLLSNQKRQTHDENSKTRTTKTVSFQEESTTVSQNDENILTVVRDKENAASTPLNSLRRRLRSTVSPPSPAAASTSSRPKATPFAKAAAAPVDDSLASPLASDELELLMDDDVSPAAAATSSRPQSSTPFAKAAVPPPVTDHFSLLASELEMDDVDESLIISPTPAVATTVQQKKPAAAAAVQPQQQLVHRQPTQQLVQQHPQHQQQEQQQPKQRFGLLNKRRSSVLGGPRRGLSAKPQIVHRTQSFDEDDDDDDTTVSSSSSSHALLATIADSQPTVVPSTAQAKKPSTAVAPPHTAIASATQHNPVHGGSVARNGMHQPYEYGPARLTPLGAVGVCMDLSNMFQDVQSTKKRAPPPSRTHERLLTAPRTSRPAATRTTATITTTVAKQRPSSAKPPMSIRTTLKNTVVRSSKPTPAPIHTSIPHTSSSQRKQQEPYTPTSAGWAEQQCELFTEWLNYTIQPNEDQDYDDAVQAVGHNKIALRTLLLHQRMAKARYQAAKVWQGADMQRVRVVINKQISTHRIQIRKDRNLSADLTLRKQILSLLFSYSTPWLRLGLETMFHVEILPEAPHQFSPKRHSAAAGFVAQQQQQQKNQERPKSSLSRMQLAIKNFVIQRVLSDDQLLKKYTKGLCKVPSGRFEQQYQAELRSLVLSRLLQLFFFLDRAKQDNILDKSPRLFANDAKVKSSKDVLNAFCRDFLSSEGDFCKHLSRVGLKVHYQQFPIDELDFLVTNLAVDLRDGSRLARMLEVLTHVPFKSILERLRLPAVSRLPKLRNVGIVLDMLKSRDINVPGLQDIAAHQIVDGHRERVLQFLWAVVAHFCIERLLNTDTVEQEIQRIRNSRQRGQSRRGLSYAEVGLASPIADAEQQGEEVSKEERLRLLLLRWVCEICSTFGVFVSNLSTDFADGMATCLLIHYYHPTMLRISEIQPTLRRTKFLAPCTSTDEETLCANERQNCELARNRMSLLGGMANVIPISDSHTNVPDDRVMLLCLTFLFSRLLESSHEVRNAHVIQTFMRQRLHAIMRKRKKQAAKVILQAWRINKDQYYDNQFIKYGAAVGIIEAFVCQYRNRLAEMRHERIRMEQGATVIQKYARRWISQKLVHQQRCERAAVMFQCWWRRTVAMQKYYWTRVQSIAASMIQRRWRHFHARLVLEYNAAVRLQTFWRRRQQEIFYTIDWLDIQTVQSCVRRWMAIRERNERFLAVRVIQVCIKGYLLRKRVRQAQTEREQKEAAVALQCAWRCRQATIVVQKELRLFRSAKRIQALFRGYRSRSGLQVEASACKKIQALCRGAPLRASYRQMRVSAIKAQTFWRSKSLRRNYILELARILHCQSMARGWLARCEAEERHQAVVLIQSAGLVCLARWELATARAVYHERQVACVSIQRCWRRASGLRKFTLVVSRIILAQSVCRRAVAVVQSRKLRAATLTLQSIGRAWLACQQVAWLKEQKVERERLENAASITIQRYWRGAHLLLEYKLFVHDVVVLQTQVRRFLATRRAERMWYAMLLLQNVARVWLAKRHVSLVRVQNNAAAVHVQRTYRGYVLRREMFYTNVCAAHIQRIFRGYSSRRAVHNDMLCIAKSQSVVRMWLAGRVTQERYDSLIRIQACARRHVVTRQMIHLNACAALVQRVVRGHSSRRMVTSAKRDIVMAQSLVRRWIAIRTAHDHFTAIVFIQASARRHLVIHQMHNQQLGAVLIQRVYRGHSARRGVKVMMRNIFNAQSLVRVWLAHRVVRQRSKSIVYIQSSIRRHLAVQQATTLKTLKREQIAAVTLQCFVRCMASMSRKKSLMIAKQEYQDRVVAATAIQVTVRMYLARQKAATRIQKTWRCYTVHIDFMLAILLTIKLQSYARRVCCQNLRKEMTAAVLTLQRFGRLAVRRIRFRRRTQAATVVQSIVRMCLGRTQYMIQKFSAVAIQRCTRGYLTRSTLEMEHFAATEIQRIWRGYDQFAEYACAWLSTIIIQCAVRNHQAVKVAQTLRAHREADLFHRRRSARLIQRAFRWHAAQIRLSQAASIVQRAERARRTKNAFRSFRSSIIQLQSIGRGRIVRRKQPKKMVVVVRRIKEAGKKARADPKLRLDNRTKAALHVLRTSKRLVEIMNAVCTLEMATRYSKACCIAFSQAGATGLLFDLIRTCNRSLPHVQLLHMILQTMSNVSSHDELLPHVATKAGVGVFLDLVQMFRDQEHVFTLAVSLLERVILCSPDFQAVCSTHENLKRLKSVHTLCVRKLSIAGSVRTPLVYSTNRLSADRHHHSSAAKSRSRHCNPDLQNGVHTLERVIRLVDKK